MKETCEPHGLTVETDYRKCFVVGGWVGMEGCPKCEEEYNRRALVVRIQKTNIPPRFIGRGFDAFTVSSLGQRRALEIAREYCTDFPSQTNNGRCLIFLGSMGTGKSHLASAVLSRLAEDNRQALYVTVPQLLRNLRAAWGNSSGESELFRKLASPWERFSESELLKKLASLDLLVLDEVGVQHGTEAERVQLSDLIDIRYQSQRPCLVVSNCDIAGLASYLGPRAVDRLKDNGGEVVCFNWPSYRGSGPVPCNLEEAQSGMSLVERTIADLAFDD